MQEKGGASQRRSRNFTENEFLRFHRNFLDAVPRGNRIKSVGGNRIASLSTAPRIRTNIFPKQPDCVEPEDDGREGNRERKARGCGGRRTNAGGKRRAEDGE